MFLEVFAIVSVSELLTGEVKPVLNLAANGRVALIWHHQVPQSFQGLPFQVCPCSIILYQIPLVVL